MNHYNYFRNYENRNTKFYVALQGLSKGNMNSELFSNFGSYVPKEISYSKANALKAYNFAIIDLGLYLDTHPDDITAKKLYDQYVLKFNDLKKQEEESNKMVTLYSPNTLEKWEWNKEFPWESEK